jgi:hypothetical protein
VEISNAKKKYDIETLEQALIVIGDLHKVILKLQLEISELEYCKYVSHSDYVEELEFQNKILKSDNTLYLDLMTDLGLAPIKIEQMSVYQAMQIDALLQKVEW